MKTEIKILMIDDDEEDFIIVKDLFKEINPQKYSVDWVSTYKEGLDVISEKKHDAYLIDYRLGPDDGLELIREVIRNGCESPLILLTGQNDINIDKQAMIAGASDYLVKGAISATMLERSIRYGIAHAEHIKEIKHLNAHLERKVKERTLELTNALEREQAINEMKSRFVSFASHEFRTPLSAILSSASLIEKYREPEQEPNRLKHINRISSSVRNLTDILNDFLSLAQLDKGAIEVQKDTFDLRDFLEMIVDEMEGMITKKKQSIIYKHEGETIVVQPKKILKNILLNLLSNASKYSPDEKEIVLSSSLADNKVTITVKDNGIGIPETDQEKLFGEFFRASNVGNIQGTGLGLNIVKRYMELLDGNIDLISRPQMGTTITIEFPQLTSK